MLKLLREGYARDLVILFLLTILVGGAAVSGTAYAFNGYFDRAVSDLIGSPGEYDVLVHLRADVGTAGINALSERFESVAPGFRIKVGPTLAGRINVFIGLPEAHRQRDLFETMHDHLRDLPGFDGYTFVVEPSVIIRDAHPETHETLSEKIKNLSGVRFPFQHGSSLWVVLTSRDVASKVQSEIERIIDEMAIVDVRFAAPLLPSVHGQAQEQLLAELAAHFPNLDIEALDARGSAAAWVDDLVEVRALLEEVAAGSDVSLAQQLNEVATLLEETEASGQTGSAGALETLDMFYAAIEQVYALQERLTTLEEQLVEAAQSPSATNVIISMLVQNLIQTFTGESGEEPSSDGAFIDPQTLQDGLDQLASRLSLFQEVELAGLGNSLRQLEQLVGGLDVEALNRAITSIDRMIELQGTSDRRLEVLLVGNHDEAVVGVAHEAVTTFLQDRDAEGASVYMRPVGTVEADVRTTLLVLIDTAGDLVNVLVALFVTTVFFFLDTTTLLSFVGARQTALGNQSFVYRLGTGAFGAVWFTFIVVAALGFGSGGVPFMIGLVPGAILLGLLASLSSGRISPVDANQLEAAASLGLSWAEILRKVVIPGARPGLLYFLNRPFSRPMIPSMGR